MGTCAFRIGLSFYFYLLKVDISSKRTFLRQKRHPKKRPKGTKRRTKKRFKAQKESKFKKKPTQKRGQKAPKEVPKRGLRRKKYIYILMKKNIYNYLFILS